jgi:hypothetical protein
MRGVVVNEMALVCVYLPVPSYNTPLYLSLQRHVVN